MTEELIETTVATLAGVDVGIGNIWERAYTRADGEETVGAAADLYVFAAPDREDHVIAGAGSVFSAGSSEWEVLSVEPDTDNRGRVMIRERAGR